MDTLLRKLAEWKGRSRAAQVIVFDGGAELDRSKSFLRGAVAGVGLSSLIFFLTAPGRSDPYLMMELDRREAMVREANARLTQAVSVADMCLSTAQQLESTLAAYQSFLSGRTGTMGVASR